MRELRKTLAYFLGVLLASTLGYQLLHPAFLRIADWLSPVFGTPLLTALMSAFLLFGDPLRFAVLPAIWSSVAFIGGLIIRRRVGAVATMVAVLLSFLSLLAASVFGIIETVSELGLIGGAQSPLSLLPPFPRGLSLAQLMEAPIVGRLLEPLLAMVEAGGPGRPQEIVMGVVTPLIVDLGEKLVVVCVSALVGVEVGKRVERRFTPWSEAMRVRLGGAPKPGLTMVAGDIRGKALPIILIIVLPSVAVAVLPPRAASTDDYFSENLLGVVDDHGGTYVPAVFLDSGMAVEGVDVESPEVEGLLAAVLLSQESILDALPEMGEMTGGFDVGSLKNLMPPTALAMVYVDIPPEVAEERADVVSSAFSAAFGVGLRRLIAFTPPMAEEGAEKAPAVSIVVYQSPEGLGEMAEAFVSRLPVERGGLVDVIEEAYINGRLIPGARPESADGAMFLAGFINLAALSRYVPLEEVDRLNISRLILPPFDAPLGFTGVVSYWESGVRSPPRAHRLDLLSLLGVGFSPRFSAYADLSNLLIVAPNQTVGAGVEEGRRVIKLVTTAPLDDPRFEGMIRELSRMMTVAVAPPGSALDPSSFRVTFSALLPLDVQVSKQVIPQATATGGEVQVTVVVKNNDVYPMEDVVLDDGDTVLGYQMSAAVTSGSTREMWSVLHPGESRTLTYTIRLGPGGVYTLRPARAQYVYEGEAFSESSEPVEVRVSYPSAPAFVAEGVAASWTATARALDAVTNGNGSNILLVSTMAWVVALAYVEFRGFRRWLAGG